MKYRNILILLCFIITIIYPTAVLAWEKEDHEIFELTDNAQRLSGDPKASFYSLLEIDSSATLKEINTAYRRKSYELHPDKNPDPQAGELYALLSTIVNILKDEKSREKYDYHYKNGIPRWRGTGYFYRHYKPGFFTVIIAVLFIFSVLQYLQKYLNYYRLNSVISIAHDAVNKLTFPQIKQMLKKANIQVKVDKKDFNDNKKTNFDILFFDLGLDLGIPLKPIPPNFFKDTVLFSTPTIIYNKLNNLIQSKLNKSEIKNTDENTDLNKNNDIQTARSSATQQQARPQIKVPGLNSALKEYYGTDHSSDESDLDLDDDEIESIINAQNNQKGFRSRKRK